LSDESTEEDAVIISSVAEFSVTVIWDEVKVTVGGVAIAAVELPPPQLERKPLIKVKTKHLFINFIIY